MRRITALELILFLGFFQENTLSAEVLTPENLAQPVDAEKFFEVGYLEAFTAYLEEILKDQELQKAYPTEVSVVPIFKEPEKFSDRVNVFAQAKKLEWLAPFLKKYETTEVDEEGAALEPGKFSIVLVPIRENDEIVRVAEGLQVRAPKRIRFYPGVYRSDIRAVGIESRVRLPPALWLSVAVHELRHAYDHLQLKTLKAKKKNQGKDVIKLEKKGWEAGIITWRFYRKIFTNVRPYKEKDFRFFKEADLVHERANNEFLKGNEESLLQFLKEIGYDF